MPVIHILIIQTTIAYVTPKEDENWDDKNMKYDTKFLIILNSALRDTLLIWKEDSYDKNVAKSYFFAQNYIFLKF